MQPPRVVQVNYQAPRAGGYAAPVMSWLSTPVQTATKARKHKATPAVVYPNLAQCANLCTDQFWRDVFTRAAQGKFPRGFTCKGDILTYKNRNKVQTMTIPQGDAQDILPILLEFFRVQGGIASEQDEERVRQEREARLAETQAFERITWPEIRKKKALHDLVISTYIDELAQRMELKEPEKMNLKTTINLGFLLGCFTDERVQFDHGKILALNGLTWDAVAHVFSLDPTCIPKEKRSRPVDKSVKKETVNFLDQWGRFLGNLDKTKEAERKKAARTPVSANPTPRVQAETPQTPIKMSTPASPALTATTPDEAPSPMT
jgi:hypothetical protein